MSKIIEGYVVEPRTPWYEDENYELSYEIIDGHVFVHIILNTISKSILSDIKAKWNDFRLRLYSLGYEYVHTYTDDLRIVNLVGDGVVVGEWNNKKVISWELN